MNAITARHTLGCLVLAVALGVTGGCGQQYNGAWSWGSDHHEHMQRAVEVARLQREREKQWAEEAARRQAELDQRERELIARQQGAFTTTSKHTGDQSLPAVPPYPHTQPSHPYPTQDQASQPLPRAQFVDGMEPARRTMPVGVDGSVPAVGGRPSAMDGSGNTRQITFTHEGADFDPTVSPDGKSLAFASTRHRRQSDIYMQRIGGTSVRQVTSSNGNDVMPAFSPDGRFIAFASDRDGKWDIWIVDADGKSNPRQVTSGPTHDIHPSFSPDGRHLVYCSYGSQSGQWELWTVNLENPADRRNIGYGLFPQWSPTDNRIVFQRARQRGARHFSVWTVELDQGEAKHPTEVAASANAAAITPQWSPDGKALVFCTVIDPDSTVTQGMPKQSDIWVIDLDGRNRVNLTQSNFANVQPVWSRDGNIYFVSNRGKNGVENIWMMRPPAFVNLGSPEDEAPGVVDAGGD